jgi:hypothetical protein
MKDLFTSHSEVPILSSSSLTSEVLTNEEIVHLKKMFEEYDKTLNNETLFRIISFVRKKYTEQTRPFKEEMIGIPHNIIKHFSVSVDVFKDLWSTIINNQEWTGSIKNIKHDSEVFHDRITIIPVLDMNSDINEFIAIWHDTSELVSVNLQLAVSETFSSHRHQI